MLIPVGQRARQELLRITRTSTSWKEESLIPVLFVPMPGEISDSR